MSQDLIFWRYKDEARKRSSDEHLETYSRLSSGHVPDDLKPLPGEEIDAELWDMHQNYWDKDGNVWTRDGTIIEVHIGSHYVRFDLRGKWTGEDANALIDLMNGFECPLFDPQSGPGGERFTL